MVADGCVPIAYYFTPREGLVVLSVIEGLLQSDGVIVPVCSRWLTASTRSLQMLETIVAYFKCVFIFDLHTMLNSAKPFPTRKLWRDTRQ